MNVKNVLFLNVNEEGHVLPSPTNELMTNSIAVQAHLTRRYKEDQQAKPPRLFLKSTQLSSQSTSLLLLAMPLTWLASVSFQFLHSLAAWRFDSLQCLVSTDQWRGSWARRHRRSR